MKLSERDGIEPGGKTKFELRNGQLKVQLYGAGAKTSMARALLVDSSSHWLQQNPATGFRKLAQVMLMEIID